MAIEFSERPKDMTPIPRITSGESLTITKPQQGIGSLAGFENSSMHPGTIAPVRERSISDLPYNHELPQFDVPQLEVVKTIPVYEAKNDGEGVVEDSPPSAISPESFSETPNMGADQPMSVVIGSEDEETFNLATASLTETLERYDPEGEITTRQRDNLERAQTVLQNALERSITVGDMINTVREVWATAYPEEDASLLTEKQALTAFAELSPRQQEIAVLRFEEGRTVVDVAGDRELKAPGVSKQIGLIKEKVRKVALGEALEHTRRSEEVMNKTLQVKGLIEQGLTTPRQIADALGVKLDQSLYNAINRVAETFGLEAVASVSKGRSTSPEIQAVMEEIRPYLQRGIQSASELAKSLGGEVTYNQVDRALRVMRESGELAPRQTAHEKRTAIYQIYTTENLSRAEISRRLGIPLTTIDRHMQAIEKGWTP